MEYKVTNNIDGTTEYCQSKEEVAEFIQSELTWWNQYEHINPYTEDEFEVEESKNT